MSELEVRRARMEVEKSAAELERALDGLRGQIEDGARAAREIGARVKETSELPKELIHDFIDSTVAYAKGEASGLFRDLREAAEDEFQKLDRRPFGSWTAILMTGLAFGFLLGRSRHSEPRSESRPAAFES